MRRLLAVLVVLVAIGAGVYLYRPALLPGLLPGTTPHERYLQRLERAGLADTAIARDWKAAADRALSVPTLIALPADARLDFPAFQVRAAGYRVTLRRGRVLRVAAAPTGEPARVFIDLFRVLDDGERRHVASAADDSTLLTASGKDRWIRVLSFRGRRGLRSLLAGSNPPIAGARENGDWRIAREPGIRERQPAHVEPRSAVTRDDFHVHAGRAQPGAAVICLPVSPGIVHHEACSLRKL